MFKVAFCKQLMQSHFLIGNRGQSVHVCKNHISYCTFVYCKNSDHNLEIADQFFDFPSNKLHAVICRIVFAHAGRTIFCRLAVQDDQPLQFVKHFFVLGDDYPEAIGACKKRFLFVLFQACSDVLCLANIDVLLAADEAIDRWEAGQAFR
jgi:hypothetical protein